MKSFNSLLGENYYAVFNPTKGIFVMSGPIQIGIYE
jgi:hypothetical protein